ncbi:MAG: histidinol dehydrogenase, partial [Candidatus Desulfatibia sp.]|uniref:histidinol dehydrogenase n=1 Tax=Candidatus Desulfatibia sp. TaxID=3101189 RepID=UPI002F2FE3A8
MKKLNTRQRGFDKKIRPLVNRFETSSDAKIRNAVARILKNVQTNGDNALFKYTKRFDRLDLTPKNVRITEKHFKNASDDLSPKLKSAIKTAYKNINSFHKKQVEKSWFVKKGSSRLGQLIRPIERVGLYVPGGTASYPSSVLMNAIPARVAGVKEIIICSPAPGGIINSAVLYAASLCGVKDFYAVGGAQAVAAMAFGTKSIKRVDKIVGPGNAYVAEAKRAVFGMVDIDMIAGPSEICIIADSGANPAWCA